MEPFHFPLKDWSFLMSGTGAEGMQMGHENIYDHCVGLRNQTYSECWDAYCFTFFEISEKGGHSTHLPLPQK